MLKLFSLSLKSRIAPLNFAVAALLLSTIATGAFPADVEAGVTTGRVFYSLDARVQARGGGAILVRRFSDPFDPNGSNTDIEPINYSPVSGDEVLSGHGLVDDGNGSMYALLGVAPPGDKFATQLDLVLFTPVFGNVSTVVTGLSLDFVGLAYDESSGTLYGITSDGASTLQPESLYSIDTGSGATTLAVDLATGTPGEAVSFDGDGVLHHFSGDATGTHTYEAVDVGTSTRTPLTVAGDAFFTRMNALAYWSGSSMVAVVDMDDVAIISVNNGTATVTAAGELQASTAGIVVIGDPDCSCDTEVVYGAASPTNGQAFLYRIEPSGDPNTPSASTLVGPLGYERFTGLDFSPVTGVLYGVGHSGDQPYLVRVDPCTGATTEVGAIDLSGVTACNPAAGCLLTDIAIEETGTMFGLVAGIDAPGGPHDDSGVIISQADGQVTEIINDVFSPPLVTEGGFGILLQPGTDIPYVATPDTLYITAPGSSPAPVAALSFPGMLSPYVNSLDWSPTNGVFWASVPDGSKSNPLYNVLATIDAAGTVGTLELTVYGLTAIAVSPADCGVDLAVTKSVDPDPVLATGEQTFTITVTNNGDSATSTIGLYDVLPADAQVVSYSIPTDPNGTCGVTVLLGDLTCDLSGLGVGESVEVYVTALAPSVPTDANDPNDVYCNFVEVGAGTDLTPDDNVAYACFDVIPAANISVTKVDDPDPVLLEDNLTYTIVVENLGPQDANDVTMTDTLPAGTSFVGYNTVPAGLPCTDNGATFDCDLGDIGVGEEVTVVLVVNTETLGTITNTVEAYPTSPGDPNENNNVYSEDTLVVAPDLAVSVTDNPDPANHLGSIFYTVDVANIGDWDASNASLVFVMDANTTFVAATPDQGSCAQAAGTVTCDLGDVAQGSTVQVVIEVVVSVGLFDTVTVSGTVDSETIDSDTSNNSFVESTAIGPLCARSGGCFDFELLAVDFNVGGGQAEFTYQLVNNCSSSLERVDFRFVNGGSAVSPSEGSPYTSPTGHNYTVDIVGLPHPGIGFTPFDNPIGPSESDVFQFRMDIADVGAGVILWNSASTTGGDEGRMDMRSELCYTEPSGFELIDAQACLSGDANRGWSANVSWKVDAQAPAQMFDLYRLESNRLEPVLVNSAPLHPNANGFVHFVDDGSSVRTVRYQVQPLDGNGNPLGRAVDVQVGVCATVDQTSELGSLVLFLGLLFGATFLVRRRNSGELSI